MVAVGRYGRLKRDQLTDEREEIVDVSQICLLRGLCG